MKPYTYEEAINNACERLPEGWKIRLDMENGAVDVSMLSPKYDTVYPRYTDESLPDQIDELVDYALLCTPA